MVTEKQILTTMIVTSTELATSEASEIKLFSCHAIAS